MCLYPKLIKNPKYKANKKNGGNIPPVTDERIKYVPVGCQNCIECRKQKARDWQVRLQEHIKTNHNGKFITLTFNNESYTKLAETIIHNQAKKGDETSTGYILDNEIATKATRLFLERWRKQYKKSTPHWLVTELGHNGTERIHLHGLIWTDHSFDTIEKIWQYGWIYKGDYVNSKTINYIIKYINKIDNLHTKYKSIILTSPGIGSNYTNQKNGDWNKNKYKQKNTNETYRTQAGYKLALPIYYRNKIYTEEEKEKLWINKIDKQTRYVLGNKIDISQSEDEYNRALKYAQIKNKELGYGDNSKNWEQEQYERETRILKQQQRMQNTKSPPQGGNQIQ